MLRFRLLMVIGIVVLFFIVLFAVMPGHSSLAFSTQPIQAIPNAERHVCLSGCPYVSVQSAVDAANDGDVIKVAAGTYTGVSARPRHDIENTGVVTQMVYISKSVIIQGGYITTNWIVSDPVANPTTLNAQGQGRVMYITGNISPTIEGLRLTGGNSSGLGGDWYFPYADGGGGAYVITATALFHNNQVFSNTSTSGAGLYLGASPAIVTGNTFNSNAAFHHGGGVYLNSSPATLSENIIISNTAAGDGGGLFSRNSSVMLTDNTFNSNAASFYGGGLTLMGGSGTLAGNTVTANRALNTGGGLQLFGVDATLINNLIADNQVGGGGSGLDINSGSQRLFHNTFSRNNGGAGINVYYGTVVMTNTILVSQTVGIAVESGRAVLEGTLWGSGVWANGVDYSGDAASTIVTGTVNIWGDPDFVNPAGGDYHIGPASAAVDAGVASGITSDIDGDPRPAGFGFDIGADERLGASLLINAVVWPILLNPGQMVTYTLSITSAGVNTVTNVWLTDTVPSSQQVITLVTTGGSCTIGASWGGNVSCFLGTMTPGTTAQLTLTTQVTATPSVLLPWLMRNEIWITSADTIKQQAFIDTLLQDCHVRINDDSTEYASVPAAVDASTLPTDVVKVAGACADVSARGGVSQMVFLSKTLTLQGGWNADFTQQDVSHYPTILDARGRGRVLYITGDISPTIEGLRITGGNAYGLEGASYNIDAGGGIYVISAAVTLTNNQIFNNIANNTAALGGGVYLLYSTATFSSNQVFSNTAGRGGGVSLEFSTATLSSNQMFGNTAGWGGGAFVNSSVAVLSGNQVLSNTAGVGGGLYLTDISKKSATVTDNTIASNHGGGIYDIYGSNTLTGNTVTDNDGDGVTLDGSHSSLNGNIITANHGRGLVADYSGSLIAANVIRANDSDGVRIHAGSNQLENNIIADNLGNGIYTLATISNFVYTTIALNEGTGIVATHEIGCDVYFDCYFVPSQISLTNTILVSNSTGIFADVCTGDPICHGQTDTVTLTSTLWGSGSWANSTNLGGGGTIITGTLNIFGDPGFVSPVTGDYHLRFGSAAIDAGINAGVTTDIDGQIRPCRVYGGGFDQSFDLGADEYCPPSTPLQSYLPIVLRSR